MLIDHMSFGDGIPRINCYSLTDFNTFDFCPFRFYVTHHLGKKYEIEEGNLNMALGSVLDESIKKFHKAKAYGQPSSYLINIIRAAVLDIKEKAAKTAGKPSYYSGIIKFIDEDLIKKANEIFINYYEKRDGKINQSLGEVKFCEWLLEIGGEKFKLWGWPDTYEMGEDGIAEIVDYKFREDIERGKENMDMDLMPKIYALLAAKDLKEKGYNKARFKVRFWQDSLEEDFFEEFDLDLVSGSEYLFKQKLEKILGNKSLKFCEKGFCSACNNKGREQFILELEKLGILYPF